MLGLSPGRVKKTVELKKPLKLKKMLFLPKTLILNKIIKQKNDLFILLNQVYNFILFILFNN